MIGLVRPAHGQIQVLGLRLRQRRELDVELFQMCARDLLVKRLGQHVHAQRELFGCRPQGDLREDLVGERAGHDEGGVARCAADVSV
jgi:hypothetical protein